ncbi:hypothetical protein ACF0H5_007924 [Mactra antiquata]
MKKTDDEYSVPNSINRSLESKIGKLDKGLGEIITEKQKEVKNIFSELGGKEYNTDVEYNVSRELNIIDNRKAGDTSLLDLFLVSKLEEYKPVKGEFRKVDFIAEFKDLKDKLNFLHDITKIVSVSVDEIVRNISCLVIALRRAKHAEKMLTNSMLCVNENKVQEFNSYFKKEFCITLKNEMNVSNDRNKQIVLNHMLGLNGRKQKNVESAEILKTSGINNTIRTETYEKQDICKTDDDDPENTSKPVLIMNVVPSEMFEEALFVTDVGGKKLAFTLIFPEDCKMPITVPVYYGGYINIKDVDERENNSDYVTNTPFFHNKKDNNDPSERRKRL